MAYYAELRAAMSLLAASGVGIFLNKHYVITGALASAKLSTGDRTHVLAWDALAYWGRQRASGDLFSELIKPGGISVADWLFPVGGRAAVGAQASAWFLQWGQDLKWGAKDRNLRNESSYRPDGLPKAWATDPADCLSYVQDFWSAFEPASGAQFSSLDRQILRLVVENTYRASSDSDPIGPGFEEHVDRIIAGQGLPESAATRWKEFLTRRLEPADSRLLSKASVRPNSQTPDELGVTSRAALLLRLSTGAVADLMTAAGISSLDTGFWWQSVGVARGFWSSGAVPDPLTDMWADVRDALDELEAFQARYVADQQTAFRVQTELAPSLPLLSSAERIGLWSLYPA
ncbi:hypothetical protein [Brevundimonas viscosa]|uniref:hypothetical protein n=1 Tax=Brevundimonas viscosa TaxID=871741 RepID=UPI0015A601CB|nr:hypothetical protein [Brevundimonas viscosa]